MSELKKVLFTALIVVLVVALFVQLLGAQLASVQRTQKHQIGTQNVSPPNGTRAKMYDRITLNIVSAAPASAMQYLYYHAQNDDRTTLTNYRPSHNAPQVLFPADTNATRARERGTERMDVFSVTESEESHNHYKVAHTLFRTLTGSEIGTWSATQTQFRLRTHFGAYNYFDGVDSVLNVLDSEGRTYALGSATPHVAGLPLAASGSRILQDDINSNNTTNQEPNNSTDTNVYNPLADLVLNVYDFNNHAPHEIIQKINSDAFDTHRTRGNELALYLVTVHEKANSGVLVVLHTGTHTPFEELMQDFVDTQDFRARDVCATLCALLNVPLPADSRGRVLPALLRRLESVTDTALEAALTVNVAHLIAYANVTQDTAP